MNLYRSGEGSRRCVLETPSPTHYDFLFQLAQEAGRAWPWGDRPVGAEMFAETLWAGVSANAVVLARSSGEPLGYVSLDKVTLFHGTGFLNAYLVPSAQRQGGAMEGVLFFIDCVFDRTPIRKLCMESIASISSSYGSLDIAREEARFVDHIRVGADSFTDLVVRAIHRVDWLEIRPAIARQLDLG